MDSNKINGFVKQMEDSLPRGNVYHINYTLSDRYTDAYYSRNQEMVKYLEANYEELRRSLRVGQPTDETKVEKDSQGLIDSFKRASKQTRHLVSESDLTLDGIGFYLKNQLTYLDGQGKGDQQAPTIYISDGKLMGVFYMRDLQAVIQPATERPQVPEEDWRSLAYNFLGDTISGHMAKIPALASSEKGTEIEFSGENPVSNGGTGRLVLKIDKSELRPIEIELTYINAAGKLTWKAIKKWQFQTLSGISLPKQTVEQTYQANIAGDLNLERERIFTLNSFSTEVASTKESLKNMLKSNFSIYDEVTGTHYLSGNPETILNKISK
jgi:hypothetical protein